MPTEIIDLYNFRLCQPEPNKKYNIKGEPCNYQYMVKSFLRKNYNQCILLIFAFFMLYSLYSLAFAFKRLLRPGLSAESRSQFIKKHFLYVFAILVFWIVQLIHNYKELFHFEALNGDNNSFRSIKTTEIVCYCAMLGTGFVLASIRMIDPYYRTVIYTIIMECFGEVIEISKTKKIQR